MSPFGLRPARLSPPPSNVPTRILFGGFWGRFVGLGVESVGTEGSIYSPRFPCSSRHQLTTCKLTSQKIPESQLPFFLILVWGWGLGVVDGLKLESDEN